MKHTLIIVFIFCSLFANAQDSTGQFTVKAPVQLWQQVLEALDKSTAPHTLIVELNKFIVDQINQQVKKPAATKTEPTKKEGAKQ